MKRRADSAEAPVWSADGRWIAFLNQLDDGKHFPTHIVYVHPNGKGWHEVWKVSNLTNIPTLAWSRNGRCVAYQWGEFGDGALAMRNPDFSEGINLVPFSLVLPSDGAHLFVPESVAFSANGKLLYMVWPVTVNKKQFDRIYALPLDKPNPPAIVADDAGLPLESPDGRLLTFADLGDGWTHIRKVPRHNGGRRFFHGAVWDWTAR